MLRQLDRYELLEEVGSGGMATVYRARDLTLRREVALKLLHPHLANRPEARARFAREARAVARLHHPSILAIYDTSEVDSRECYLVTEFIRGPTLKDFVKQTGFGFPELALLVARALADALAHAHAAGVVHRDLKPENVMISDQGGLGRVKLTDFGIAKLALGEEKMTMTGTLVGSPQHMAPEILEGKQADARSDIFSLGTLIYWLATEKFPFDAANPTAVLRRIADGRSDDPRLLSPHVSDGLADLIHKAMARQPTDRYRCAEEMRDAIDLLLMEVGLSPAEQAAEHFFESPVAAKEELQTSATAKYCAIGTEAAAQGDSAKAISAWNRALSFDPSSPSVLASLAKLTRQKKRQRRRRLVLVATLGALLTGTIVVRLATTTVSNFTPPVAPSVSPVTAMPPLIRHNLVDPPPPTPTPVANTKSSGSPAEASQMHPLRMALRSPVRLPVQVRPYAGRAILDGVEVSKDVQGFILSLESGRPHRLRVEHPCCEPYEKVLPTFTPGQAISALRVDLAPLPARIRVDAEPEVEVFVDGKRAGTAADSMQSPFEVPVSATGEHPYQTVAEVRLEQPGKPPYETRLSLRAGADVTLSDPRQTTFAPENATSQGGAPSEP